MTEKIGFAHMLRDVLLAAMTKGQFSFAMAGLIVLAVILKMPPSDLSRLGVLFIKPMLRCGDGGGLALVASFAAGWFFHMRLACRALGGDAERLRRERPVPEKATDETGRSP